MDNSGESKGDIKCLGTNSMYRNNCLYNTIASAIERTEGVDWMAGTWIFDWNNLAATPFFSFSSAFFSLRLPALFVQGKVRSSGLPPLFSVDDHVDPSTDKRQAVLWGLTLVLCHSSWEVTPSWESCRFYMSYFLPCSFKYSWNFPQDLGQVQEVSYAGGERCSVESLGVGEGGRGREKRWGRDEKESAGGKWREAETSEHWTNCWGLWEGQTNRRIAAKRGTGKKPKN